jgi:hypothetical protein
MNSMSPNDWQPDPQLLAAYFDGTMSDAGARARVEAWLEAHPEDAEEWSDIKKLLKDTAPAEPTEATWQEMQGRIDAHRPRPARRPWLAIGAVAAGVALFLVLLAGAWRWMGSGEKQLVPPLPTPESFEVLTVASADDVTILRIEGADTDAIVVGTFPVCGPLELADPGDVCVKCKCPRINVRQDPAHRPMIWARAD